MNSNLINFIKKWESFIPSPQRDKLKPSVINIGYGSTYYENGTKVKLSDSSITEQRATEILNTVVANVTKSVKSVIPYEKLTESQINAIVSLVYNIGFGNFKTSTLLKKLQANPNDETIPGEFLKFVYSNKKFSQGLKNRRIEESEMFKKKTLI